MHPSTLVQGLCDAHMTDIGTRDQGLCDVHMTLVQGLMSLVQESCDVHNDIGVRIM